MTPQMEPAGFGPSVRLVLEAPEVSGVVAIDIGLDRPEYAEALAAAQADDRQARCRVHRRHSGHGPPSPRRRHTARAGTGARGARLPGTRPSRGALRGGSRRSPRVARHRPVRRSCRAAWPPGVRSGMRMPAHFWRPTACASRVSGWSPRSRRPCRRPERSATLWWSRRRGPDVLHRTEAGGVVLGVTDGAALTRAVRVLEARLGPGPLLMQEEVPQGLELLVGGRRDVSFGPTVLVGLGGVLAELLRDVSIGLAPLAPGAARALLAEGRRATLLRGFRGDAPVDESSAGRRHRRGGGPPR